MTIPKQLRSELADLDLCVVKMRNKNHIVLHLRNSYGFIGTFTVSGSPSDKRSLKNQTARLRRFATQKEKS